MDITPDPTSRQVERPERHDERQVRAVATDRRPPGTNPALDRAARLVERATDRQEVAAAREPERDASPPELARYDDRDRALSGFELDPPSAELARRLGYALADSGFAERWQHADARGRHEMTMELYGLLEQALAPGAPPPSPSKDPRDYGQTVDRVVTYRQSMERHADPKDLIETLAHEYRHVWQNDAITGRDTHGLSQGFIDRLRAASASYPQDRDITHRYNRNLLELDSEKFARAVFASYKHAVKEGHR